MSKNRIFYGSQVAQIKPNGYGSWYQPLGVQSVGMSTNFETEQSFQLGALDIYAISENVPNVEATISKALDGTCPLYLMCMGGSAGVAGANVDFSDDTQLQTKGFGGLANNSLDFRLGIFDDSKMTATGSTSNFALLENMFLSNFSYTFPVDGNATEEVTLVGNSKTWPTGSSMSSYTHTSSTLSAAKLVRRQFIDLDHCVLPTGEGGINIEDRSELHLQNISISADLGREQINQLGSLAPTTRYATFPVEVTSEFEIIGTQGDYVNARDFLFVNGCSPSTEDAPNGYSNINNKPIDLQICGSGTDYLRIFLGSGNQLTSVNYTGGDAGGDNATITYSFRNYNDFYMYAHGNYATAYTVS